MKALISRDYTGEADRKAAVDLWLAARAAGTGDPWPSLDALDAELAARPGGTAEARLWEDDRCRAAGVALLLDECVLVWCTRSGAEDDALEAELIAWGLERAASAARSSGERPSLFVPVRGDDERLAAWLMGAGFQEDGWRTLRMERSLHAPIAAPQAPPGICVRPAAGADEQAAASALHAALFAGGRKARDERAALMRAPGYRPELDLVAALPGGGVVGYALGTCCVLERRLGRATGWLEYVGVERAQRGRGVGRALVLHLLTAMRAQGLDTVLLTTGAANSAARQLFAACGFRTRHEIRWFVREVDPGCTVPEARADHR